MLANFPGDQRRNKRDTKKHYPRIYPGFAISSSFQSFIVIVTVINLIQLDIKFYFISLALNLVNCIPKNSNILTQDIF